MKQGVWSQDEHDRFLAGIKIYPNSPWRLIARYVGTRSVRQVQTHAQKYHEKIARRMRGLRKERRNHVREEHRIDGDIFSLRAAVAIDATAVGSPVATGQFQFEAELASFQDHTPGFQLPHEARAATHVDAAWKDPLTMHLPPRRMLAGPMHSLDDAPEPLPYDFFAQTMLSADRTYAVV